MCLTTRVSLCQRNSRKFLLNEISFQCHSPSKIQLLPREAPEWDILGRAQPSAQGRRGLESWLGHWYTGCVTLGQLLNVSVPVSSSVNWGKSPTFQAAHVRGEANSRPSFNPSSLRSCLATTSVLPFGRQTSPSSDCLPGSFPALPNNSSLSH